MSNLSKNSILYGSSGIWTLAVLSLALLIPSYASASYGENYTFGTPHEHVPESEEVTVSENPKPSIYALSPKGADRSLSAKSITITGKGFTPTSIARINGSDRPTAFIDPTHLMVQAHASDMLRTDGGFYVTVWNEGPGGGFSNARKFAVKNIPIVGIEDTDNVRRGADARDGQNGPNREEEDFSSLTSNAVYGSGGFLPSGIIQWVLLAIIILLIVILARKFLGAEEAYHKAPMKHD